MTTLNGEEIEVLIPNKAWLIDKENLVIGLYPTRKDFILAYERYAVLANDDVYASEAQYFRYIPLPKGKKSYTYWYKFLYYEILYQLRKIYNLFKRKK